MVQYTNTQTFVNFGVHVSNESRHNTSKTSSYPSLFLSLKRAVYPRKPVEWTGTIIVARVKNNCGANEKASHEKTSAPLDPELMTIKKAGLP